MIHPRNLAASTLVVVTALYTSSASADATAAAKPDPTPARTPHTPQPLPIAVSAVPGIVLQGAGNFTAGRAGAGWKIALIQLIGASLATSGSVTLGATGASRFLSGPAAAATVTGGGLLFVAWLTDLVSVSTPDGGTGSPRLRPPIVLTEVGFRSVEDPQFDYRHLLVESVELRLDRLRVKPSGTFALNDTNSRLRLELGYRVLGATPQAATPHASFWEFSIAGTHHGFRTEGFSIDTAEVSTLYRMDMGQLDDAFDGSFGEIGGGVALTSTSFDATADDEAADLDTLLLGEFAFGLYLGGPKAPDGEIALFYDHRHDGYAGGIIGTGIGLAGSIGLRSQLFPTESLGIGLEFRRGAAWVAGASLLYRVGGGVKR